MPLWWHAVHAWNTRRRSRDTMCVADGRMEEEDKKGSVSPLELSSMVKRELSLLTDFCKDVEGGSEHKLCLLRFLSSLCETRCSLCVLLKLSAVVESEASLLFFLSFYSTPCLFSKTFHKGQLGCQFFCFCLCTYDWQSEFLSVSLFIHKYGK